LLWANYHGIYFARPPNLWWSSVYLMISTAVVFIHCCGNLHGVTRRTPSDWLGVQDPCCRPYVIFSGPPVYTSVDYSTLRLEISSHACALFSYISFFEMWTMDGACPMLRGCVRREHSHDKLQVGESIVVLGGEKVLLLHQPKTPAHVATQFVWHDAPPTPARLLACIPVVHEAPRSIWDDAATLASLLACMPAVHEAPPVAASLPYCTPPWRVARPAVVSLPAFAPVEQAAVELPQPVVDDDMFPPRSSLDDVVENRPKRVSGNVKLKQRLLKAEADGDIKRMAEIRAKRSGCQRKKKSKARQAVALGVGAV
jgi:hypothetical protein